MRNPIHVLKSLEEKASVRNYKYERLYRNLYNPEFYLLAYANIAKSQGSMTQGVDGQTLDNMSLPRINRIIESIRNRTYQPKPAKRKYIPKKNGKMRPLGITSTDDKLVQEVVRMILEAIYEPTFSDYSHGFRPKRSCHTALLQVKRMFTGVTWVVEGDIHACFDNFDHHVLVELLRKRIADEAFISLIWKFLKAGYMESGNITVPTPACRRAAASVQSAPIFTLANWMDLCRNTKKSMTVSRNAERQRRNMNVRPEGTRRLGKHWQTLKSQLLN